MESQDQEIQLVKDGIAVIYYLKGILKALKLYERNNIHIARQMKFLLRSIEQALEKYGEASFVARGNALFFNGIKIKFGYTTYHLFSFIKEAFREKNIGALSFHSPVGEDEIMEFLLLFLKPVPERDREEGDFQNELSEKGIQAVSTEEMPSFEKSGDKDKEAYEIYFLSMTYLKEVFKFHDKEKKISLLTTKRLIQSIFENLQENESFLTGLTSIKNFDEYTLNHSVNVSILSLSLGKRLGLDKKELVDLGMSAFFHDLGKLDIPKEILLKPSKLDDEERKIIENHPQYGAEKLANLKSTSYIPLRAINVALEHHRNDDETGYPVYARKKDINLFSKLVKIADVFDAITTHRPYREKDFSREEALTYMLEKLGKEFDPILLKIFANMIGACPVGCMVLLNTGEIGLVFELNPEPANLLRPKVKLITDEEGRKVDGQLVDLTERVEGTDRFRRSIVKTLNPDKYNIKVPDYFVASVK